MAYTRQELETQESELKSAISAVSTGQTYSIDGLTVTRAQLDELRRQLRDVHRQLQDLDVIDAGGSRLGQRVPKWA